MGYDDFFEDKYRRQGNYREHNDHDDHDVQRHMRGSYPGYRGHGSHQQWVTVLYRIRSSKRLQFLVILGGVVILLIAVVLIAALFPLIIKLFNYVSQYGVQGILDGVTGFLDKLWKGSGKN